MKRAIGMLGSILLATLVWRVQGQEAATPSSPTVRAAPKLNAEGFRRALEEAFDADDNERVEQLVEENPTLYVPLFEKYSDMWMERGPEPAAQELRAFECARRIAVAAESALDSSGLIEIVDVLSASRANQERYRAALDRMMRADAAVLRAAWKDALETYLPLEEIFTELGCTLKAARVVNNLGVCYESLDQYDRALDCHRRALKVAEYIGEQRNVARSLDNMGNCYRHLGKLETALDLGNRALRIREMLGDQQDLTASLNNLGFSLTEIGQYHGALSYLERALKIAESTGQTKAIAAVLTNIANCYDNLGHFEKAIAYHALALTTHEGLGSKAGVATVMGNLGNSYRSLGQHDRAVACHRSALELQQQNGNTQGVALALSNLGTSLCCVGQHDEAMECFNQALAIRKDIGLPSDIAFSFHALGICSMDISHYEQAMYYLNEALRIREGALPTAERAHTLNGLGNCYISVGEYEKAMHYHERALVLQREIGNQQDIALSLNNIGVCYHALGHYTAAIDCHDQAMEIEKAIGNNHDIALSLKNLGNCYGSLGEHEKAMEYHRGALKIAEMMGNDQEVATALNNVGVCLYDQGRFQEALAYYERALKLAQDIGNPEDVALLLNNLAACYCSLNFFDNALVTLEGCVSRLEHVKIRRLREGSRAGFFSRWAWVPTLLSQAVLGLETKQSAERGFPLVEAFLSRTLLENLQERAERVFADTCPELIREHTALCNRMVELRVALGREASKGNVDSREAERLRAELVQSDSERERFEQRLRAQNPKLGELISPRPTSLGQVQAVLAPGEAIVEYILGKGQSYVWVLTAMSASIVMLPPEGEIQTSFDALITAFAPNERSHFRLDTHFADPARQLYRQLLEPILDKIAAVSELIIVPTGFLGFLPFEVLLTEDVDNSQAQDVGSLPYLMREKTIRYAPSASFLVWCRTQSERRQKRAWCKDLCLFGDAIYSDEVGEFRSRTLPDLRRLPRLTGTRAEVMSIISSSSGRDGDGVAEELKKLGRSGHAAGEGFDLYLGAQASRANLLRDLTGYRILHLAVHGHVDEQFTWYSGLVLSGAKDEDRVLNLVDIAGLKLDAELVFLSACETARGKELGSDGIRSTMRSFLLAGAESVVATQWPVFDDAASVLAQEFYKRLLGGTSPAEALRQAKLALVRQEVEPVEGKRIDGKRGARPASSVVEADGTRNRFAHPSFWAPFILWGK